MLSDLTPLIQKLTEKQNLTADEAQEAFTILTREDLESYFYFAFTAALHTKGETSDELLGFCRSTQALVPQLQVHTDPEKTIDVSGTGGSSIKTLNVDTACAFILRSRGINVAKQSFATVTGITGSADLLQELGVDPIQMSFGGPPSVQRIYEQTGMVTYITHFLPRPEDTKGTANWVKKRTEIGLNFVTIYHLAANAYSAIPMKRRVYGVFDAKYLPVLAELFQKLGYTKGLICHGVDGLDEMSNVGPTKVLEFSESEIKEYTVNPDGLGVTKAKVRDIEAIDRAGNIADFLRVLYGEEKGPKRDLVAVNAGAAFYILDEASSFREGTNLAIQQLESGEAGRTLESYVQFSGDPQKLQAAKQEALS